MWPTIGAVAFLIGLVIAILAGFFAPANSSVVLVIGVLGIIVGFLNIADKEVLLFLVAAITWLIAASSLSNVLTLLLGSPIGTYLASILGYIVVFVGPAAAIVSLKVVYDVAKE